MKHCQKLKTLEIHSTVTGYSSADDNTHFGAFTHSLKNLPFLKCIEFNDVVITDKDATVLCSMLLKMRSMKSIVFTDCRIGKSHPDKSAAVRGGGRSAKGESMSMMNPDKADSDDDVQWMEDPLTVASSSKGLFDADN